MPFYYGNDFSAVQQAQQADEALRQHALQSAFANLQSANQSAQQGSYQNRELALRQAIQDWQQKEAQQKFGENVRQFDIGTGLANRQLDIMADKQGPDSQAAHKAYLADATADVQVTRNFNEDDWMGKVNPADLASLKRQDDALRAQEADRLTLANKVARTGNMLKHIDRNRQMMTPRAVGPVFTANTADYGDSTAAEADPAAAARLNALRQQITPYLDPKQGLVQTDPVTGALSAHPQLITPWMQRTNTTNLVPRRTNAPPAFNINSWTAPAFGGRTNAPAIDYSFGGQDARTMNPAMFAAPPQTNALVTVQTPDGRMWQIPSTNVGTALQRGARIIQ